MSTPMELIRMVESAGGRFEIDGDRLGIVPKEAAAPVLEDLRRHKLELMAELARRAEQLRQAFVRWFDARVWLDAEAVALRRSSPPWSTSVNALFADFCAWMFERDLAPPTSGQFRRLLEELCFEVRDVGGKQLVPNVAFKEDVERVSGGEEP